MWIRFLHQNTKDSTIINRIASRVYGYGLSSFWDSMPSEFSRTDKLDSRLNCSVGKSSSLVESNYLWSFRSNSIEDIVNEGVHDVHGLLGYSHIRVNLLEHLVDINGEGLNSSSSSGFSVSCFSSECFIYWIIFMFIEDPARLCYKYRLTDLKICVFK